MRKIYQLKRILLFTSIGIAVTAFKLDFKNNPWGTKTLYKPQDSIYSIPPKGFEPVFINYVGRHGARHISGISEDSIMFLVLKIADQENALTEAGKKLMNMDSLLLIVESGNVGLISEIGKLEQKSLGERMARNYPEIFSVQNSHIKVSTTKKERTKQSAAAFLQGLNPDNHLVPEFHFNDADNLAFYDVSPFYKSYEDSGNWKSLFTNVKNSPKVKNMEEELPMRFFKPSFISKLNSNSIQFSSEKKTIEYNSLSFVDGFYGGCSIIPSIGKEIGQAGYSADNLDFSSLVSARDLEALDYINTAEDFLQKGPATDSKGIQVKIAAPLLLSFINSTEDYISGKKLSADLRFAHAETISPFAVMLGISGASEAVSPENIQVFDKVWKCENIIPMSANIQWIIYQNKANGDFLVKFLLNEKEVAINGLKNSGTHFYYKWKDVKEFYTRKLDKMGVHKGDDVHEYLMNVR